MIKQRTFDELIIEMRECYNNFIDDKIDDKINEDQKLFFVHEDGLSKKYNRENKVIFTIIKKKILNMGQFRELYNKYCKEARYELKLVLVTVKPKIFIVIEVSEKKENPYGLVNVAYPMAIPDEEYEIVIRD